VSKISFTGSTDIGKTVGHAALDNMTRFSLELGGKNPMIIFGDVPVDKAIQGAIMGGFLNQGQVCAAASRLYIHRSKFDQVIEGLAAAADSMTVGAGLDVTAQINPLVSAKQKQSVCRYIEIGKQEGAKVVAGGYAPDLPGYFVRPTVIVDVDHSKTLVKEEVFGPVLVAMP
ncbi:aldehyde dehydrogenase family protein, partial [Leeia sp. TBRC 13508]